MEQIIRQFRLQSPFAFCEPLGQGHINTSYRVRTLRGPDYLLQRISTEVFHDVHALMCERVAFFRMLAADVERVCGQALPAQDALYDGGAHVSGSDESQLHADSLFHMISFHYTRKRRFGQGISDNQSCLAQLSNKLKKGD